MRRVLLLVSFSLVMLTCLQAQTRKIGHRSHSGKSETFALLMGEDHLGAKPDDLPAYEVEPFVMRIRKHYEKVAKQNPVAKVGDPQPNDGGKTKEPTDTTSLGNKTPIQPLSPDQPKSSGHPKAKKNTKDPQPQANAIPSPDFLVKSRPPRPADSSSERDAPKSGMWVLFGLLIFPVAPGIFFASAVMGRKREEA